MNIQKLYSFTTLRALYSIETPSNSLVSEIGIQRDKEISRNIWKNSKYKYIAQLESNNVGNVGENFLQQICNYNDITATIDGSKTKGKCSGDGRIKNRSVEIKTARLGSIIMSFQHELGEHPWDAEFIAFVDISPTSVYLSLFPNFTEEHYKTKKKCSPYFPIKNVTRRNGTGAFKLDTSPKINEVNPNCLKIDDSSTFEEIGAFIHRIIT